MRILFLILCLGLGPFLNAQQYNFIQYSVSEGLAQSQVYAMEQDNKGYLWLGTQGGGLSRFDGQQFDNFSTKNGLPSNTINSIYEDHNDQLWIGTKRGLCKYDGQDFHPIQHNGEPIVRVEALLQINDSTLWIGSRNGILEYSYTQDSVYQKLLTRRLDRNIVHSFFQGKNGIWIGTTVGAWHYGYDGKLDHFHSENGLGGDEALDFERTKDGIIWVAVHEKGITRIHEDKLSIIKDEDIPNMDEIWCIHQDNQGNLWMGREEKGLYLYQAQDSSWTSITTREGLPNNNIISILQDDWGNIWMATSGGGIVKYLGQFFVHFDEREGVHGDRIYAIHQAKDNKVWFSASSNGLAYYDSLGFHISEADSGFLNVKCKAILEDKKGRIWAGTIGKGIIVMDTIGVDTIDIEDGMEGKEIISMAEDSSGDIWVGTNYEGIFRIRDRDSLGYSILSFSRKQGLRSNRITTIKQGPDKHIWFATRLGEIGYFQDGMIKKIFSQTEGLTYDIAIRSIAFDNLGNIWVGTAGDGILKAELSKDSIQFKPIELREELHSYNIYLLIFDNEGNLWAGNEQGVDKLSINESGVVTQIQFYGRNKGFLGIETCQNSAICDQEGNVWFGTMNGLTQHIPSKQQIRISPPLIHFKDVSLFYQPLRETRFSSFANPQGGIMEGLRLPYHMNNINFEFKAINISNPQDIRYRWKLVGAEETWSPFSKKESVDYSNLPPGEYTFEVQAISGKDLLSPPIRSSFQIKRPIWQLLWFQLLMGTVALCLLGFILWNWQRNIKKKEKAKREQLEIENHILQLEQKALQLQMNPHFIFNALNSIQGLVATKDYSTARSQIGNFATLMRGILNNSRQSRINLQEEINTLEHYLKMEQFCQRVEFNYQIISPNNIDPEEVEIPPMLLQPFVENSIIHGISHLKEKGHIQIEFQVYEKLLECRITDNGVGRDKANELRQSKKPGHQSVAMEVTKDRLNALKGSMNYTPLEVNDVLDGNQEVKGTKVVVRLPLEVGF